MNPGSSTAWLCNPQGGLESFVILCECDPQEADALMSQVIPATLKLDMAPRLFLAIIKERYEENLGYQ